MRIHIGNTIKTLRKRDKRTQDDVAEALGITFQAVSRWESEIAYPDIELIPAIANYFGVTIDELFGFESKKEKMIDDIIEKVNAHNYRCENNDDCGKECIVLLREGLAQFPGDERLLLKLADVLWREGYSRQMLSAYIDDNGYFRRNYEKNCQNPYGSESIQICEKLVESAKDKEIAYSANHLLIVLYRDIGATDKAIACAERMPYMYRCRELALCSACDGKEGEKYLGEALLILTSTLANEVINVINCNVHNFDTDLCIDKVQGIINLFDTICEDGNYGLYYENMMDLYLFLAYVQWKRGYRDDSFRSLDTAYQLSEKFACVCDGSEQSYTAMFLKSNKYFIDKIPQGYRKEDLPERFPVWGPIYFDLNEIKVDPRWKAWEKKCNS